MAKNTNSTTDLANLEKTSTAVALAQGYDYGDSAGSGFEETKAGDLSIPFLQVLQSNSPQVEDKNPEGSTPGRFYNTVTREITDGANFLPVFIQDTYVEWVPRNKGGGFVGLHAPDSELVRKMLGADKRAMGKIELPSGNELIETHYVYGLLLDDTGKETQGFAVLAFTSTKIKPYRDWKTAMYMVKGRPPIFAFRAKITSVKQKNEKGTFHNLNIAPLNAATWVESLISPQEETALLQEAKSFRELISSGAVTAAYDTQNSTTGSGSEGERGRTVGGDGGLNDDGAAPF